VKYSYMKIYCDKDLSFTAITVAASVKKISSMVGSVLFVEYSWMVSSIIFVS
jgi:hypothetical protein